MPIYTNTGQRQLRALAGSSDVRDIDTGFATLAGDVDAAVTWARDARFGYLTNSMASGNVGALRAPGAPVDVGVGTTPAALPDSLWLDKAVMVPSGRGWEWRVRARLFVNGTAVPAGVAIRAAVTLAQWSGTALDFAPAAGPTLYGTVASAAALAASSVTDLTGAWTTAPDTATLGTEWLLVVGPTGGTLAAPPARVYARAWLEARFT